MGSLNLFIFQDDNDESFAMKQIAFLFTTTAKAT